MIYKNRRRWFSNFKYCINMQNRNRIIAAAVLLMATLTGVAQKKVDFSVRAYYDCVKKQHGENSGALGVKGDAMYRIMPMLKIGGGVGWEIGDCLSYIKENSGLPYYEYDEFQLLPVFLKAKYNINKGKFSAYVSAEGGMSFVVKAPDNDDEQIKRKPHYFFIPSAGVDWNVGNNTRIFLQLGYKMTSVPYCINSLLYNDTYREWVKDYKHSGTGHIELSAGVEF